ncbi:FAD-dependent monooxygenase [Nocardia sp. NPDC004654]|uniref:NAD(P)/FAD-dependent oxidoreductase n=1 Tax=Nocardia sp. NPDC004654 TaxID=3154776 RepID=UPI0033BB250F
MSAAREHVVVVGGGFAGLLAAAAVAPYVEHVSVVERDRFPEQPALRRGVPQARHPHLFVPGGVTVAEELLPGLTQRLIRAGAHRVGMNADLLLYSGAGGWMPRYPTSRFGMTCSRQLLDHVVYDMVRQWRNVEFRSATAAVRLLGDARAVTGVELHTPDDETERLDASLVIDATGRGSRTVEWLASLGTTLAPPEIVDSGHTYTTREFRALPGAETNFPMVIVQAHPASGRPEYNALLLPIEDGRWLVTVGGTRGCRLPADEDEFREAARRWVRAPLIGELIADAAPLSSIQRSRSTVNRRHRFDRMREWPSGFVVIGDAATALNPTYGHGLSAAARCAGTLRRAVARGAARPADSRKLQRAVTGAANYPWLTAIGQDLHYPNTTGARPRWVDRVGKRYGDRLLRAAPERPELGTRLIEVMFLAQSPLLLAHPAVLSGVVRRPRCAPPTEPPLTPGERGLLAGRQVG